MTIDQLLDRHAAARGGKVAIEALRSVSIELDIAEPGFSVSGDYRATRDGSMRIDIYADSERVFTEALGPGGGWQMFSDGRIQNLSPEGRTSLEKGIVSNLYGLHELKGLGYRLELLGAVERNGATSWEVKRTAPDGKAQHLFFNRDTFLVASDIETNALHPDVDSSEVRQETFYGDHEESGGVLFADRTEIRNVDTGEVMQTVSVTARRINPDLDPMQFVRPGRGEAQGTRC